jgi:CRISPR system Cascade subunit CasD
MATYLLLRFDAPLMSFGGVQVDRHGVTERFPGTSMLTGLVANALGYEHREFERLERLQERIVYAARCDRSGVRLVDFHTVDLGQPFMQDGWTTSGRPEGRAGGEAKTGTHIRLRHYIADAVYTVALTLDPADETPSIEALEAALREPERPLFIGRKTCLPAAPMVLGRSIAATPFGALRDAEPIGARGDREFPRVWWPDGVGPDGDRTIAVSDRRDWPNQIHAGRRFVREGRVPFEERSDDD